jgi:uncharacterized protein YggE
MTRTLKLSTAGWLALALAILLALVAAGAIMQTRPRGIQAPAPGERTTAAPGAVQALAGLLGPEAALAQGIVPPPGTQPQSGISVAGDGEAVAAPDVAYVSLGVQSDGQTAKQAMDANSTAMAATIDAIKKVGIPEANIRTTGISLTPQTSQPRPGDQAPPAVVGYRATNSVVVTVDNVARVGDVLDAAISAGANTAGGVRFAIKDENALRQRALQAAGQSARSKADAIAASLGLHVTGVLAVAEESSGTPVGAETRAFTAQSAAAAPALPVQPGELTLRVRIRVTFTYA